MGIISTGPAAGKFQQSPARAYKVSCDVADEEKMAHYAQEERQVREENLRLQRKLQLEIERREALCRTLSESESSLEMDDERCVCVCVCVCVCARVCVCVCKRGPDGESVALEVSREINVDGIGRLSG